MYQSPQPIISPLVDNHSRVIDYLRVSITDRCNLRCSYCMPKNGIIPVPHKELLSYEELERIISLFLTLGIKKVRLTGGEPFVRRGCVEFIERLIVHVGVPRLHITTNGVAVGPHLSRLHQLGIAGLNLSLDSVDRKRFSAMTRRDVLTEVLDTLHRAVTLGIAVKINCVVTDNTLDSDMTAVAQFAKQYPVSVRFIEQMEFSGDRDGHLPDEPLLARFGRLFPDLSSISQTGPTTARLFAGHDYCGTVGIIEGHSRQFCATCNKVRITPQGRLKTCLYDGGPLDIKKLLRDGIDDGALITILKNSCRNRFANGYQAQAHNSGHRSPSMASIGG